MYIATVMKWAKTCLRACADKEGPDQPAHSRSLIRTFSVRNRINRYYKICEWRERRGLYFAHAQDDVDPGILRRFEGTFSLDAAQQGLKERSNVKNACDD